MKTANFVIIIDQPEYMVIDDLGPWDEFPTITNSAEEVVLELASRLNGRRLFYCDSEDVYDELKVEDGRFAGFQAGCPFLEVKSGK